MSGEYFSEDKPKFQEGKSSQRDEAHCPYGGDCPSPKQDNKLHEMGEAIEIAETRCNTLKEQLDQMKLLYKQRDDHPPDHEPKIEKSPRTQKTLTRQNSGAIGTDNSGAAVVTINNILSGITNSINRLSELHTFMETDNKPSIKQRHLRPNNFRSSSHVDSQDVSSVEVRSRGSTDDQNRFSQGYRQSNQSISVKHKKKDTRRRSKKRSVHSYEHSSGSLIQMKPKTKSSQVRGVLRDENKEAINSVPKKQKKSIKRLKSSKMSVSVRRAKAPNNLVEIYHNKAAKGSESDDSQPDATENSFNGNRISHIEIKPKLKKNQEAVPPISIPGDIRNDSYSGFAKSKNQMLSPIEEHQQHQHQHPQQMYYDHVMPEYNHFTHSYEAPTIASRMKQVARNYFRHFHSKTIPFCAAKSTTPSHNIGINIQQVMNIIKTRQPIKGISPTLAHNIGIAAERLNNQSLSAIVSSLGTRMGYRCYPCPMLRNNMNFQHLQEMAKEIPEIPEEIEGEHDPNREENRETEKVEEGAENVWAVDPTQVNCTCVAKQGVGFQQILNKYHHDKFLPTPYSGSQSQYSQKIMARSNQKYKHIKSVYAQYNDGRRKKDSPIQSLMNTKVDSNIPLQGKEKVLKGVLVNLHAEFAQLSDKYDELTKDVNMEECDLDEEHMKDLELLEKKLNDKEEEIQMVMSLYNEVVNLKQQVKALRERASMASLMVEQQKQNYYLNQRRSELANSPRNARELKVGVHLTKLLRQLQSYQDSNKSGGK